ncbi:MAG: hypothetical protein L6R35_006037 [Caloplaca aegaea]|nr:MAG: hypothetical protein L6R35_006037 [Caloplaca aegaea]
MLSQNRGAIRGDNVAKQRRKPVRRDPEKRRQQNVQAQKKYREKLRERLNRLEGLAATAVQAGPIDNPPALGTESSVVLPSHGISSTPTHIVTQTLQAFDAADGPVSDPSAATLREFQHLTQRSDETVSELSIWASTASVSDPSFVIRDKITGTSDISVSSSSVATPEEFQSLDSQSSNRPLALSIRKPTVTIDPSLLIGDAHIDGHGRYSTTTIECGCSSPHVQIRTRGSDPFSSGEVKIHMFGPSVTAADPYINNLRIETVCTIAALYRLGMYIGITEEMICADRSFSPFFLSSVGSADDMVKANAIDTAQRICETLKPDLRPSSEQIAVDHHPYIDILPFPTLRKNLIIHQEEIDEDGFFHDMLTGLMCWGGAGIGTRDRQEFTGYASTGTPWDVRSWEAKGWFLKKYWALVGGDDGELVRQSEWWRSMRGEDPLCIPNAQRGTEFWSQLQAADGA